MGSKWLRDVPLMREEGSDDGQGNGVVSTVKNMENVEGKSPIIGGIQGNGEDRASYGKVANLLNNMVTTNNEKGKSDDDVA